MEIISGDKVFLSSNPDAKKSFRVAASPIAFKILSSQLYENKIKAIIRELSCNAIDAHHAAGTQEKPFQVHLPHYTEPDFWIRDFGTGMSRETIEHVYTTYFESTKRESNDLIGGLGLGSKTPFCYTDSFVITSFFNGKKLVYSAFLDDSEIPSTSFICEEETSEPNGMKIQFSVKSADFGRFAQEAREVFFWFSRRPEIFGQKIEIEKLEYTYSEPGKYGFFGFNPDKNVFSQSGSYVLMGNVAYAIDLHQIDGGFVGNRGTVVFAEIGSLEVAASREGLSYNKATVARLNKSFDEINLAFQKKMVEKINACATPWEAQTEYTKLSSALGYHGDIFMEEIEKLSRFPIPTFRPISIIDTHFVNTYGKIAILVGNKIKRNSKSYRFISSNHDKHISLREMQNYANHFLFAGTWSEEASRYVSNITENINKRNSNPSICVFVDKASLDAFVAAYGIPADRIITQKQIDDAEIQAKLQKKEERARKKAESPAAGPSVGKKLTEVWICSGPHTSIPNGWNYKQTSQSKSIDFDEGVYLYVPMEGKCVTAEGALATKNNISEFRFWIEVFEDALGVTFTEKNVIGLTKTQIEKVEKSKGDFVNFFHNFAGVCDWVKSQDVVTLTQLFAASEALIPNLSREQVQKIKTTNRSAVADFLIQKNDLQNQFEKQIKKHKMYSLFLHPIICGHERAWAPAENNEIFCVLSEQISKLSKKDKLANAIFTNRSQRYQRYGTPLIDETLFNLLVARDEGIL